MGICCSGESRAPVYEVNAQEEKIKQLEAKVRELEAKGVSHCERLLPLPSSSNSLARTVQARINVCLGNRGQDHWAGEHGLRVCGWASHATPPDLEHLHRPLLPR